MAEVSVIHSSQVNDFKLKKPEPVVGMKRKTPSQLREEQLKRRAYEKPADKGNPPFKVPLLVNTRVTQAYPVIKPIERCRPLYRKDGFKHASQMPVEIDNGCGPSNSYSLEKTAKESANPTFTTTEKCIESALRDVVQLHLRDEKPDSPAQIDMETALKGFRVSHDPMIASFPSIPSGNIGEVDTISANICPSEISILGKKTPLDLSLKTSVRLVSSSSVKWCQRIDVACAAAAAQSCGCHAEASQTKEALFSKALSSWIYPQSTLPTPIISAMASSKAKADVDFLEKRRHDWENSFRNIYCMLRKNLCSIFYVYTSEFVALFVGGNSAKKRSCSAYLSKSTNSLRSVLRKHDVPFTMPLYHNEEMQASEDDLAELSEIEKRNLGQAVYSDHFAEVDGTSQSLLSFTGNKSVHGLYDFLLNHRFLFTSLNGGDVPQIYSPVPFQNSSLNFPEVCCKEMRKAGMVLLSGSNENTTTIDELSNSNICYSIEITNSIIPPWVISGICSAMNADGTNFDSFFTVDYSSMGLNAALNSISRKLDTDETVLSGTNYNTFGIPDTVLVPSLHTAAVQRLKYTNSAYMVYTTS